MMAHVENLNEKTRQLRGLYGLRVDLQPFM